MRWSAKDTGREFPQGVVTLDGVPVRGVRAFNTDEGFIEFLCASNQPGHGKPPHVDPLRRHVVCTGRRIGNVEFIPS